MAVPAYSFSTQDMQAGEPPVSDQLGHIVRHFKTKQSSGNGSVGKEVIKVLAPAGLEQNWTEITC